MEFADPKIIVRPRPKKSVLPPLVKRRKVEHKIDEINFDFDARADYLSGFHKRKVQRAKQAQLEAAKKEREERISMRKQLREERKQELEEHVNAVNTMLKQASGPSLGDEINEIAGEDVWNGFKGQEELEAEPVDHEEEYIDEDRYTTVTVEAVDISKEGLVSVNSGEDSDSTPEAVATPLQDEPLRKKGWPRKERKKFRYESKAERKVTRGKQKAGNKARADARRGNGS